MIIIEANEIPKEIFEWYSKNSNGIISRSVDNIVTTELDDMPEEFLYPSQAWASISTSQSSNIHKIRWYNDAKNDTNFYWRECARKGKKVMIMGSLHTGSISDKEIINYDFLFPDFFHDKPRVNNPKYQSFQNFNYKISIMSGRKTSLRQVVTNAIKSFLKYPILSAWGLSIKDFKTLFSLILRARKDPEVLRNIQFLMQSRIFINELKKGIGSDLSIIFTNHVASCLHRNYIDFKKKSFSLEENIKKDKILKAMKLLESSIEEAYSINNKREIYIITALGQKFNKHISENYKLENTYDYKLVDKDKFLSLFIGKSNGIKFLPEMIPQYTFDFEDKNDFLRFQKKAKNIGSDPEAIRFGYYVPTGEKNIKNKGLFLHTDIQGNKITCTTTVRPDDEGYVYLNNKKIHYQSLGFTKFKVSDFHHGEHSRFGCLIPLTNKLNYNKIHFSKVSNLITSQI